MMKYLKLGLLASTMALSVWLPADSANNARPRDAATASQLYDKGKFAAAQKSYQSAVGMELPVTKAKTDLLAQNLLGLARSQAATGNWAEAEKNYTRALNLAEAMEMPRSFIDQ